MGLTLVEKIIKEHTTDPLIRGEKINLKIDQTLTQDATGTMAYLELESIGIGKVKTKLSVSYVDHNTLQNGFENADDHRFLQSVADKHGIYFSRVGNGICHQVHLERFAHPGYTLLGSDSHTPTAGGMGSLAIGAGGLDVACAMAGMPFPMVMPKIVNVKLHNKLPKGVAAKDIILYVLKVMTVKGGVNKVIEYSGDGVLSLEVPERATITNMGAELGATSSVFPSDDNTLDFLKKQNREADFVRLEADKDAVYDEVIEIDLSTLKPMLACPNSPDNVKEVSELVGTKVNQVLIGSCTNSSYYDFIKVASVLKGKHVHKDVSLGIAPGSKQVLEMITKSGILSILLEAGARILESACGPCIGMGQAPCTDAVSLRTFNRNFYGRSGTNSAQVYLVSPELAALSAVNGCISDPSGLDLDLFEKPSKFLVDDSMILKPTMTSEIILGPNIKPLPKFDKLPENMTKKVILKVEDNITTDHIMPAGSKVLPYRSNIEKISEFVFYKVDENFKKNCNDNNGGIIVGGNNYGQGSSREHAAIAPRYLGIRAVIAKGFARIHRQNLINFGIMPLTFINEADYDKISQFDELVFDDLKLEVNKNIKVTNKTKNYSFEVCHGLTEKEIKLINAGGLLNTL